jgi:hypothetical protein
MIPPTNIGKRNPNLSTTFPATGPIKRKLNCIKLERGMGEKFYNKFYRCHKINKKNLRSQDAAEFEASKSVLIGVNKIDNE